MPRLLINGAPVRAREGATILQAAWENNIYIPALCAHPGLLPALGLEPSAAVWQGRNRLEGDGSTHEGCRLCLVEVQDQPGPITSCHTPAREGMVVATDSPAIQAARRQSLARILATHPHACLACAQREGCAIVSCSTNAPVWGRCCWKVGRCELRKITDYYGVPAETPRYLPQDLPVIKDEPFFDFDYNLCIGCGRCVRACRDLRGIGALGAVYRGGLLVMGMVGPTLRESGCKFCGACVEVCPTGAIMERDGAHGEHREALAVPCRHRCPAGIDVPRYVRLISQGKYAEATAVVREKVPFPGVLGRVCFHPCETVCRRSQVDQPIAICALKRAAADRDDGLWKAGVKSAPPTGKRVAVIGAGPAGLTAAYYLARLGHGVTLFERLPEPGGMMRVGIPEYRLPREVLSSEIEEIKKAGVEVKSGEAVESLDSLKQRGYSAVFIGLGAHQGAPLGVPGEDLAMECVDFLRDVALGRGVKVGERVAVVGGGNAAMDAARSCLRLGAREVTILYRRDREEMPAEAEEVEAALEEGVKVQFRVAPSRIARTGPRLQVECTRMEPGEPDESGRRRPVPIPGSQFSLEFDTVIVATGERAAVPAGFGLGDRLRVAPDTLATSRDGVFAGGDAVSGPASVIEAIAMGRKAASAMDRYLGGRGAIEETLVPPESPSPWLGREEGFGNRPREALPAIALPRRLGGFLEVSPGFDEEAARREAARCFQCDLRLQVPPPIFPPEPWLAFTAEAIATVPEKDGVFQLLDEGKAVLLISGTATLRSALGERLGSMPKARYFVYEEAPLFTSRESQLIQQYLQQHGHLPEGNDELADLF